MLGFEEPRDVGTFAVFVLMLPMFLIVLAIAVVIFLPWEVLNLLTWAGNRIRRAASLA